MRTRNGIYHFHTHTHTHRFVCMCWICDVTHTKHRHRLANFKINITCTSNWKHKSIQWTWKIAWISGVFWFYLQKNYRLCNWMLFGHSMQKKRFGFCFYMYTKFDAFYILGWGEMNEIQRILTLCACVNERVCETCEILTPYRNQVKRNLWSLFSLPDVVLLCVDVKLPRWMEFFNFQFSFFFRFVCQILAFLEFCVHLPIRCQWNICLFVL